MSLLGKHLETLYLQFFEGKLDEILLLENLKGLKLAGIRDLTCGQRNGDTPSNDVSRPPKPAAGDKFSWTKD